MIASVPKWTIAAPMFAAAVLLAASLHFNMGGLAVAWALALGVRFFAAVHHAEMVAQRIGEPHGTLVLALACVGLLVVFAVYLFTIVVP